MSKTVQPGDDIAELVQYLPMLRRLAAYERWSSEDGTIPEQLVELETRMDVAGRILMGVDEMDKPTRCSTPPNVFERSAGEVLPAGARNLLSRLPVWADELAQDSEQEQQ